MGQKSANITNDRDPSEAVGPKSMWEFGLLHNWRGNRTLDKLLKELPDRPEESLYEKEARFRDAVNKLPEVYHTIIEDVYLHGERLGDNALRMGKYASGLTAMHKNALLMIRIIMDEEAKKMENKLLPYLIGQLHLPVNGAVHIAGTLGQHYRSVLDFLPAVSGTLGVNTGPGFLQFAARCHVPISIIRVGRYFFVRDPEQAQERLRAFERRLHDEYWTTEDISRILEVSRDTVYQEYIQGGKLVAERVGRRKYIAKANPANKAFIFRMRLRKDMIARAVAHTVTPEGLIEAYSRYRDTRLGERLVHEFDPMLHMIASYLRRRGVRESEDALYHFAQSGLLDIAPRLRLSSKWKNYLWKQLRWYVTDRVREDHLLPRSVIRRAKAGNYRAMMRFDEPVLPDGKRTLADFFPADESSDPSRTLMEQENAGIADALYRAVRLLPDDYRTIIEQRYLSGDKRGTFVQMASALHISQSRMSQKNTAALLALKTLLQLDFQRLPKDMAKYFTENGLPHTLAAELSHNITAYATKRSETHLFS